MPSGTGVVSYNSVLQRRKWIKEGLVGARAKSIFAPFTGTSSSSIVMQANDLNAANGQNVIFDYDGYLVDGPVADKTTARGKGEQKTKFSDSVTVRRFRFVVDNGDKFDASKIDSLNLTEHSDSRTKLAEKFMKFKDQAIIDAAQQGATHVIQASTFTFDDLLDIANIIKTGRSYDTGANRMPLEPFFTSNDGRPMWVLAIDSDVKTKLLKSTGAQNFFKDADVRGNENRVISGVLGKIGNFVIVEWDQFFGRQRGTTIIDANGYALMDEVAKLQWQGLRQYKDNGTNTFAPVQWQGFSTYEAGVGNRYSRCLILGARAVHQAFGLEPDYRWKSSDDFDINSESCLEVWMNTKLCTYTAENEDYDTAVAGISNGVVALDVKI